MNSRPLTSEETPSTRHPARSRYSLPNNTAPAPPVSTTQSTLKSKTGINGRGDYDEDLSSSSRRTKTSLDELERDFNLARNGSNASTRSRDHPWKSPSNSGDALDATTTTAAALSPGNNTFVTNDRWTPDLDYDADAKRATSNAVVEMATKFADLEAEKYNNDDIVTPRNKDILMGGDVGSGMLHDDDDDNNNKEYIKSRLTDRLVHSAPAKYPTEYDRVRNQAMKMLAIADGLSDSPSSPSRDDKVTGLFRTSTGGLSMRHLDDGEVSFLKKKQSYTSSSIRGIERYGIEERVNSIRSGDEDDLPYSQHSANDEYADVTTSDDRTAPSSSSSSWSSRYSVERQLMAITGGLDSTHILNKMDNLNHSRQKTKSARGMYRSSAAAMDGSGEEYGDYTKEYSTTGGGIGGVWNYVRGTLWSDLMEMNYDGTTQSLVRREKRRVKRRRILMGLVGLVALSIVVGVLVVKGNPKSSFARGNVGGDTVVFYVLADEPYDLSNVRQLTRELENLPSDAEFLVHLGNANGDSQSRCQEYGYERAASILRESPVPTFVIPGDRDWVRCKRPSRALEWWSQNLGMFDTKFEDSKKLNVAHQEGREENFAFLYKGVLFLSVHIVDTETDATEWTSRHERNVMWTKEQLNRDGYRSVVIFGHAPPSSKQGEYFWPIVDQLKDTNIPVLYLHANTDNGEFEEYHPYGEADNFSAVQLEKKGREAPMRVTVWGGKKRQNDMFEFTRRNHDGTPEGYDAQS